MRLSNLALLTALQVAVAQVNSGTTSSAATASTDYADTTATASAAGSTQSSTRTSTQQLTQTISVGGAGHTFNPAVVQLSPGNVVEFAFYPTNHSVIRAEYKYPCIPYEMTGIDKIGFNSGFRATDAILAHPDTFRLLINDSNPIFFYCGAPGSCINYQMVGVINPNASVSLEVQKQFAANSSFMLLPGEPFPDESSPFTTSSTSASSTPTATSSPGSSSATGSAAASSTSSSSSLSTGAIVGIAIGGAAVAIAAAALLFYCGRKSRRNKAAASAQPGMTSAPPAYVPPGGFEYSNGMQAGGMTPTINKHMSAISGGVVPLTDAFGNPTGQYTQASYPAGFVPQQGYPMMSPQPPQGWSHSPSTDIFGQAPNNSHEPAHMAGAELSSQRASSPGSNYVPPAPPSAGIQGFLQRQSRMSPPPESEIHSQQSVPLMSHQRNPSDSGVYEMPAAGPGGR